MIKAADGNSAATFNYSFGVLIVVCRVFSPESPGQVRVMLPEHSVQKVAQLSPRLFLTIDAQAYTNPPTASRSRMLGL